MPVTGNLQLVEAVIDRFDGAPVAERRRWSDDFKEQAVAAALEPDMNVSALARRLGITPSQLFGWRKALRGKKENDGFSPRPLGSVIEIVVGDATIRVGTDVNETALRCIIRAVRTA